MNFRQIFTTLCIVLISSSISSQVPNTISYQGRLTNATGVPVADNSYLVKFIVYDAVSGGTELWNSNFQTVITTNGLFVYELGSITPLPLDIFDDLNRYLGVTVGIDLELSPRTKLNSVPYSLAIDDSKYVNETGDTMSGNLWIKNGSGISTVNLSGNDGGILMYGLSDGLVRAVLSSNPWGSLRMNDNNGNNTIQLEANNSDGGVLILYDPLGDEDIILAASTVGNATVSLPDNAIDNTEILDEPGIASNRNPNGISLTISLQDIETVTITIPADGYINVRATCFCTSSGSTESTLGLFQIVENSNGSIDNNHYAIAGSANPLNAGFSVSSTVFTERIYYKTAGTYTFRLEGTKTTGSSDVYAQHPIITATYFPTSYGTVATSSAQPPTGIESETVQTSNLDGSTSQTYEYDLRDLELKAKEAALKLKKAELELLKAKQHIDKQ